MPFTSVRPAFKPPTPNCCGRFRLWQVSSEQDQMCVWSRPLSSGGNLAPESRGTAADVTLPYTRPALGTTACIRDSARIPVWFLVGFAFPELSVLVPPPWFVDTVPLVVGKSPGRKDRAGWQRRLSSGDFPTSGSQSGWSLSLSAPQHVYLRHLQPACFFLLGPVGACDRQSTSSSQIPDAL